MTSLHNHNHSRRERSKSRGKVPPILRRLTSSEKNSLDLDRPAAEQFQNGLGMYEYGTTSRTSSPHDIGFSRRGYHHRSTSGTSQFSTATTGSGRNFVHPFQQTPRPYTPPLTGPGSVSYQNSLRESEDISPTAEEGEDTAQQVNAFRSPSNLSNRSHSLSQIPSVSNSQLQGLGIHNSKPERSRLALTTSHTSLHHMNLVDIVSPTDTMISPISAMRSSIDKGFRLRSHSEVDTVQSVREARRKFEEKENAKEHKYLQDEMKAQERRQQKEAREYERQARRTSNVSQAARPGTGRSRKERSRSDLTAHNEKVEGFYGRGYDSVPGQNPPVIREEAPEMEVKRRNTAKARSHSAWTKFLMWLRTRLLRMSSKKKGGGM